MPRKVSPSDMLENSRYCQATRRGVAEPPCATSGAATSVVSSMKAHSSSRLLAITPRFMATMNASVSVARGIRLRASMREVLTREDMYTLMPRKTQLITIRNSSEVASSTK